MSNERLIKILQEGPLGMGYDETSEIETEESDIEMIDAVIEKINNVIEKMHGENQEADFMALDDAVQILMKLRGSESSELEASVSASASRSVNQETSAFRQR